MACETQASLASEMLNIVMDGSNTYTVQNKVSACTVGLMPDFQGQISYLFSFADKGKNQLYHSCEIVQDAPVKY